MDASTRPIRRFGSACLLLLALSGLAARGGEDDVAAARERLAEVLGRIASADEQEALRLFRTATAEGVPWGEEPKAQADLVAAVWARCTTASAKVALVRAIESRSLASAVPTLRTALRDPEPEVAIAAIDALAHLGLRQETRDIVALASRSEAAVRARAARVLGVLRVRDASTSLLGLCRDPDAVVRAQAAFALGRLGPPGPVDVLAQMLEDPAPGPRGEAAVALGRLGAARHADAVARHLRAQDSGERWRAARALGEMGAKEHAPTLARLLTHEDPWARGFAAWSLGLLDARDHTPALVRLLEDENAWVRVYAVQAVGRLGDRSLAATLAKHLTDMASCSLLRYEDPDRLELAPAVVGETAMQVLRRWGSDLTAEAARIAKDLQAPDAEARSSAIEALVMLGAREHTAAIAKRAKDTTWPVRRDAVWALAVLGASDHAAVAAGALTDPEPTIRAQALWALGILRSRAHRDAVRSFADDETLAYCVSASTSSLPTHCVGRQSTLSEFAREALQRIGPE